ncbi:MAG TPA: tetratricopeptide repeat protein [Chthoniobacterales bacterium]|nr:tetratricopeptide repeat protein [Chthoniobacterales bacterium]
MSASIPLVRPAAPDAKRAAAIETVSRIARADWFRCILLAAVVVLIHSPALQGQRIWDDQYLAHDNPIIKSPLLILESFRHHLFLDSLSAHYRPVQNISFIFDYYFWNTDEFGFHLTNTLLHAGAGILLYFLIRQLLSAFLFPASPIAVRQRIRRRLPWISNAAFLVALLWVVHPVHSAAVDYISGRADSLAFFFAAAAWLLFLKAQNLSRTAWRVVAYGLAVFCGLFALLSREIGCIWIVLFITHLLWIDKAVPFRRRLVAISCCLAMIGIYAGLRQLPAERATMAAQPGWTAPVRAVLMARSLGDYARLMVWPANLHMERTVVDPGSWRTNADWRRGINSEYLSIIGLLLLALLVYGSARKGRGQNIRTFGAVWFFAAYLPISNLFQLNATVAEHWLYLPLVGFLIFALGWAIELPIRYGYAATIVAIIAAAGLSGRSFVRSSDWANEETFYKRTLEAGGESARVSVNLAQIYVRRGNYALAEKLLREVLQKTPDYPTARINLGNVLIQQGKNAEAETLYHSLFSDDKRIRKEYPRTWISAVNLACVRHKAGDDKGALSVLDQARAEHPGVWEIISYEAELRREVSGASAALPLIEDFVRDHWWHYGAAVARGRLYAEIGNVAMAETALSHASRLDVHDAEALHLLAAIKLRQNDLEAAFRTQRRAISRQPEQPSQYILLSNILERMGRGEEARAALAHVSHLRELADTSRQQSL